MALFLTLVLPLYLIIGLGVIAGFFKILGEGEAKALLAYVFSFAMPIAVFNFFINSPPVGLDILPMMGGYFIALILMFPFATWVGLKLHAYPMRVAGGHAFTSICGNAVFLGLPIAMAIEGWGPPFLMLMVVEGIIVFGVGTALMTWPEKQAAKNTLGHTAFAQLFGNIFSGAGRALRNPIVFSAILGAILSQFQPTLPAPLSITMDKVGATAGPTGLFVIGLSLAMLPRASYKRLLPAITSVTLLKLVMLPILTGGIVWVMTGGNPTLLGPAILMTAMPSAVASVVYASRYEVFNEEAAACVTVGTAISLITIPIILALFGG